MSDVLKPLGHEVLANANLSVVTPELFDDKVQEYIHASDVLVDTSTSPQTRAVKLLATREDIHQLRRELTIAHLEAHGVYGSENRRDFLKEHKIDWEQHVPRLQSNGQSSNGDYQHFINSVVPNSNVKNVHGQNTKQQVDVLMHMLSRALSTAEQLAADPEVVSIFERIQKDRYDNLHSASMNRAAKRREQVLARELQLTRSHIALQGRDPNEFEQQRMKVVGEQMNKLVNMQIDMVKNDTIKQELLRRGLLDQARSLRGGLMVTVDMQKIIDRTLPSLKAGKPLFLLGETGGAKTALARYISREYFGTEPEVLDGNPEMTIYNTIGKTGLRRAGVDSDATESYFDAGPLYRAMSEGKVCIGDEIDNMPTSFLIGLNRILQLRPGDVYMPPGGQAPIHVKHGFCFIATANMKSERYNRQKIDPSTLQRFRSGAGVERIRYPDADEKIGLGTPTQNITLAAAALVNENGRIVYPAGMDANLFNNLVRAAHTTQRLFSDASSLAAQPSLCPDSQLSTRATQNGEPVLKEAVIAPRELIGMLDYL